MLRREKLTYAQLAQWRRQLAEHGVDGLKKSAPGPAPKKSVEQKRIERLEKENQRLRRQLEGKESCLMLKKSLGSAGDSRRKRVMNLLSEVQLAEGVSERLACDVLDLCRTTVR